MELKEARGIAETVRASDTYCCNTIYIGLCDAAKAIVILDDRITELEAQRDELLEALLGFALKTSHRTPSFSREWLQAVKIICAVKGKPWEEIDQPGVAG